jgi:alkaline phosphatase D
MQMPRFFAAHDSLTEQTQDSPRQSGQPGQAAKHAERRRFIRQLGASALAGSSALGLAACSTLDENDNSPLLIRFAHGVASGDPLTDRIILWTRVTPQQPGETREVRVTWQIARDRAMQHVVNSGEVMTGPDSDYTVKVDATGLLPGQVYYYRFGSGAVFSPLGRSKTLPGRAVEQVTLAVFSCANYPAGYFNVYADATRHGDLDAALHIGDYIYEYESTGYACGKAKELGRVSEPLNLLLVLSDYRQRYAQYRSDHDLQAIHAHLPFITVWDDHEFADDTWRDGAAAHKAPWHGPFSQRKKVAMQAYHEWLPTRLPDPTQPEKIYRSFDFGKLLSLHMLDTRVIGRDQQIMMDSYDTEGEFDCDKFCADVRAPRRQMLGQTQLSWLERSVKQSQATWQVLGQQVLMARMEYPQAVALGEMSCKEYLDLQEHAKLSPGKLTKEERACLAAPKLPCYMDSWDGYPGERERVLDIFSRNNKNLVVLTGDTHNAWASDLSDQRQRQVGVEFATPSVSSPGWESGKSEVEHTQFARIMEQIIDPLYYAQTSQRGYMVLTATVKEVRCDWHFVSTVHQRSYTSGCGRSLRTLAGAGKRRIVEVG